jgi:hypothetical protein
MAQPTAYSKTTNFAQDEANNVGGRASVRTSNLDAEFRNIETTLDETLRNLALIQRDDGKLIDGLVELYNLSSACRAALQARIVVRGLWATSVSYAAYDMVDVGGLAYICAVAHTSGNFVTDYAAGRWQAFNSNELDGVLFTQSGTGAVPRDAQGKIREVFCVDDFGAVGDGVTDDSAALALAAAAVNAADGGVLELRRGATYIVGGQTMQNPPLYTYFTWPPNVLYPLEFANCTRGVVVRGNGARIKCMDNAKYGVFNTDGTPMTVSPGYVGVGASSAYYYMVYAHGCVGVHIENLELDGNLNNLNVNGHFSDVGIQLQGTGLFLEDNAGPITISNVYSHHHGLDGAIVDGFAFDATSHKEHAVISGGRFECNGRQGLSFVGGKGWSFIGCSFSYTGKANRGSDAAGQVSSNPGAGVDFEAEGGKEVRDVVFDNCEFIANAGQGIVADSGTDVDRITFRNSTFIGTSNYVLWTNRPGFRFQHCRILGTCVNLWDGTVPFKPQDALVFEDCFFSNEAAQSPTGTLFDINDLLWEGGSGFVAAYRCTFEHHLGTAALGNVPALASGNGPLFVDCNFIAKAGALNPSGRFRGRSWFIEDGGLIGFIPGAYTSTPAIVGKTASGPSESAWVFRTGGVATEYPASVDLIGNVIGIRSTGANADFTCTVGVDRVTQDLAGTLTADRAITLSGGKHGSRFHFTRSGGGAFKWTIGGVKILSDAGDWATLEHNGTAWFVAAEGTLRASGGTVTQITNKSTGVTLNKRTGEITMEATDSIAAGAVASFTLTNSTILANDNATVSRKSGGTAASYRVWVDSVAAGSCVICVENRTAGALAEAVKLQFTVVPGAIA